MASGVSTQEFDITLSSGVGFSGELVVDCSTASAFDHVFCIGGDADSLGDSRERVGDGCGLTSCCLIALSNSGFMWEEGLSGRTLAVLWRQAGPATFSTPAAASGHVPAPPFPPISTHPHNSTGGTEKVRTLLQSSDVFYELLLISNPNNLCSVPLAG